MVENLTTLAFVFRKVQSAEATFLDVRRCDCGDDFIPPANKAGTKFCLPCRGRRISDGHSRGQMKWHRTGSRAPAWGIADAR